VLDRYLCFGGLQFTQSGPSFIAILRLANLDSSSAVGDQSSLGGADVQGDDPGIQFGSEPDGDLKRFRRGHGKVCRV
jgi:hypothetical protein